MTEQRDPQTPQQAAGNRAREGADNSDRRWRMRVEYRDLIEDLIEDGRQRGLFDDLPGKGRPLELDDNQFEGSAALSNRLLKDNDLRPVWLSSRLEVQEQIDRFREDVGRTWERYAGAHARSTNEAQRAGLVHGWSAACRAWEARIVEINKRIDTYNLKRPGTSLEVYKLRLDYELERAGARSRLD